MYMYIPIYRYVLSLLLCLFYMDVFIYIYIQYLYLCEVFHAVSATKPTDQHCPKAPTKEWDQMLSTLRQLYVRLLDGPLQVNTDAAENKAPADDSFKKVPKWLDEMEV